MPTTVKVELGERSYEIHIGVGMLAQLGTLVGARLKPRSCLLVSDSTIAPLYADDCARQLASLGCPVGKAIVPAGEGSKNGQWLFHLYEKAVEQGLDRKSLLVALGGGVVGDLGGYAAASYLRGIPFVQIPTTLLAMVDSAVGGKTGINLPQGKNLVGAFHQPALVVADLNVLHSLPRREYVSGLAEVIKYGVIWDPELFRFMEERASEILKGDVKAVEHLVARSCEIKAEVVGRDEREEIGLRALLNFGHTIGHAIEVATGYGSFLHGEAISIGMVFAARLSVELRDLPRDEAARIVRLLDRVGLPTFMPDVPWEPIRVAIGLDKKSAGGKPRFVLAERLGRVKEGFEVDEQLLKRLWAEKDSLRSHGF